jgi:hypothetical protein
MEVPVIKNRLLYALAAFAVSPAMGCVIVSSSDDGSNGNGNGNGDARGQFDVIWKVSGLDASGDGCTELPGADSVEVVSQPLSGGSAYTDIYNCEAGGGITALLPLGNYEVWANVRDEDNRLLAQSQVLSASLTSDGQLIQLAELGFLNAQFEATWALTEDITEQALTCDEVVAGGISFVSTLAGSGGTAFDDIFPCPADATEGDVETAALPLGDYTISVSLLEEETDEVLGQAEPKDGTLENHASVEDLGVFDFRFAPEGTGTFDVEWKVDDFDDEFGDGCAELDGFDYVEVISIPVGGGDPFVDVFNCEDGQGITAPMPLGDYDIHMNVRDEDDRLLASSDVQEVRLNSRDEPVEVPLVFGFLNAQFKFTWRLTDQVTDEPLDCDEVDIFDISLLSTLADSGGTGFDDIYDCPAGENENEEESSPLPLGDYTISLSVLDVNEDPRGTSEPRQSALVEHASVEDLGIFEFFFD